MILEQELKGKTLSPQEVRSILKTDNKEIVELCKRASILPRKNSKGQTYFSYEEVKNLRKVQAMKGAAMPPAAAAAKLPSAIMNILASLKDMETTLDSGRKSPPVSFMRKKERT